jgi:hypothetical protein
MQAQRRVWIITMVAAVGAMLAAACGGSGPGGAASPTGTGGSARATGTEATAAAGPTAGFPDPTRVDNPMFPLVPGTQFTYQGTIVDGGTTIPHSVVFTVTDLTKMVDGVQTVVAWDRDFRQGRLQEQELAFFAQDSRGNVWNFGEYPEEYENGKFTGAPSTWARGTDGAYGGIHILARPAAGAQYVEGRVPSIDFYDISRVTSTGQVTCALSGCFRHVAVVDEWSPGDPKGGHQIKYYAAGTGLVRVGAHGGDQPEFLKLASARRLGPDALAQVRAAVLAMDRRAYRVAPAYRATRPAACCHPGPATPARQARGDRDQRTRPSRNA